MKRGFERSELHDVTVPLRVRVSDTSSHLQSRHLANHVGSAVAQRKPIMGLIYPSNVTSN